MNPEISCLILVTMTAFQVGSCGGTGAIVRAMAAFPANSELQGEACTAMTNSSHNCDRNRILVIEAGGLVLVLDAMQARVNLALGNAQSIRNQKYVGGFAAGYDIQDPLTDPQPTPHLPRPASFLLSLESTNKTRAGVPRTP